MKPLVFVRRALTVLPRHYSGKIFYQPRVDKSGNPVVLRRFLGELNRKLIEKGSTPPWIMTPHECLDHWNSLSNDPMCAADGNRPCVYAQKSGDIIDFLHKFWSPDVGPDDVILEVGCNCGVNLEHLRRLGYKSLSGIEINAHAVQEMKRAFPDLVRTSKVSMGSVEDLLPEAATDSVDVIFTIATAMHFHPKSNFVFAEMVRVARKYICTVELEVANCSYLFARNYRRVFQRLGCPQLKSVSITKEAYPGVSRDYDGAVVRLFSVRKQKQNVPM